MKKFICLLILCCMTICFCACRDDAVKKGGNGSSEHMSAKPSSTDEGAASSEDSSSSEKSSSSEGSSSSEQSSNASSSTPPKPSTAKTEIVNGYPVFDPDNVRGLSTVRNGYSYGIAKNGQPHSISVNNQNYFDSLSGVKALTLDRKSSDKCMYLTFDCGYEYQGITGEILDILKEKNVKAAFFCTLDYLEDNKAFVRRMIDEGHIVGNHSATHPDFTTINRAKMAEEIYIVEDYLEKNYNYKSPYFRFPTGAYSHSALDLVTSAGYKSIFWSIAHKDWETQNQPSEDETFETVTSRYHSGAVILLHAVSSANRDALDRMIDKAHADGYVFKSLNEYFVEN